MSHLPHTKGGKRGRSFPAVNAPLAIAPLHSFVGGRIGPRKKEEEEEEEEETAQLAHAASAVPGAWIEPKSIENKFLMEKT